MAFLSSFSASDEDTSTLQIPSFTVPAAATFAVLAVTCRGGDSNSTLSDATLDGTSFEKGFTNSRIFTTFLSSEIAWLGEDDLPSGSFPIDITVAGTVNGLFAAILFFDGNTVQAAPQAVTTSFPSGADPMATTLVPDADGTIADVIATADSGVAFTTITSGQTLREDITFSGAGHRQWNSTNAAVDSVSIDMSWDTSGSTIRANQIAFLVADAAVGGNIVTANQAEPGDVTSASVEVLVQISANQSEPGDVTTASVQTIVEISANQIEPGDTTAASVEVIVEISANQTEPGDVTLAEVSSVLTSTVTANQLEDGDTTAATVETIVQITANQLEPGDVTAASVAVVVEISANQLEVGDVTVATVQTVFLVQLDGAAVVGRMSNDATAVIGSMSGTPTAVDGEMSNDVSAVNGRMSNSSTSVEGEMSDDPTAVDGSMDG